MLDQIVIPLPDHLRLSQVAVFVFLALALGWALRRARGPLPAISQNHSLNVLAWFGLALMVPGAVLLLVVVWQLLMLVVSYPGAAADGSEVRWHSSLVLALLAALGAIIGVVFAFIRVLTTERQTRAAEEQAKHAREVLFNERLSKAQEGLYAQRQVTVPKGDGDFFNAWEDDIVRRSAAIGDLERLVDERPGTAAAVAAMLSVYVRELSKQVPAENPPEGIALKDLGDWGRSLKLKRPDMEKAVQVLGSLRRYDNTLKIDLREANLQAMGLAGYDFDGADFSRARLDGSWLVCALLTGARLSGARLRGTNLSEAQLRGAHLSWARLQGATLWEAQLQGAHLSETRLQWAMLCNARLQNAWLGGARLQGADLDGARMQGANLDGVQLDETTSLSRASFRGAALRTVDLSNVSLDQCQIDNAFGDGSVVLPATIARPEHFARGYSNDLDFIEAWVVFQREIGQDRDNPD